jgi:uncharacterized protein YecT (DUF1311 family)
MALLGALLATLAGATSVDALAAGTPAAGTPAAGTPVAGAPVAGADCGKGRRPIETLMCRDGDLAALDDRVSRLFAARRDAASGEAERKAMDAQQKDWLAERNTACPVAAGDLAQPAKALDKAACMRSRLTARLAVLEAAGPAMDLAGTPVRLMDVPPSRLSAMMDSGPPPLPRRAVTRSALAGRWGKADPATRRPIDDCRASYLDIAADGALTLTDPRLPRLPPSARLAGDGDDPATGIAVADGAHGVLRLDAAETPRRDRVVLTLDEPLLFGATFIRCR